jgi:hypothetical protein
VALSRKFVDSEGVHWQVYELTSGAGPSEMAADSWLYFFSRGDTRSLAEYPDDWAVMDWPALERLCRHARPPVSPHPPAPRPSRTSALVHGTEL